MGISRSRIRPLRRSAGFEDASRSAARRSTVRPTRTAPKHRSRDQSATVAPPDNQLYQTVILSAVADSRSESAAKSKDPVLPLPLQPPQRISIKDSLFTTGRIQSFPYSCKHSDAVPQP